MKDVTFYDHILIALTPDHRIRGMAAYPVTVRMRANGEIVSGANPTPGTPVDITPEQARDYLGEGGDLALGLASARDKLASANDAIEAQKAELEKAGLVSAKDAETIKDQAQVITDLRANLFTSRHRASELARAVDRAKKAVEVMPDAEDKDASFADLLKIAGHYFGASDFMAEPERPAEKDA